jgi:hypothetical protein
VLTLETSRHKQTRQKKFDSKPSLARIRAEWRKAGLARGEERTNKSNWIAGAVAIYSLFTGQASSVLLQQLEDEMPSASESEPSPTESNPLGTMQFREGRSTPAPPRPPGAQRSVD